MGRGSAPSARRQRLREEKHVTHIDSETKHETKLLISGLESFYAVAIPLAWPIVRIAVGWNLLVHGWGKVTRGPSAYIRAFVEQGFDPALPWIWAALIIEFVGGIALIIGLFTRFFAAATAVEMLIITITLLEGGIFLAQPRLRIHAAVGSRLFRDRVAGRRALFGRSPDRRRAVMSARLP
jgi:uncharacterized membrane protein YphA (DoxX/SURF4 family)